MKCSDVLDFEDLKIAPMLSRTRKQCIYRVENCEIMSVEPEEPGVPERMSENFGEFYKSLIPPERISASPKAWLFRSLSEL